MHLSRLMALTAKYAIAAAKIKIEAQRPAEVENRAWYVKSGWDHCGTCSDRVLLHTPHLWGVRAPQKV